MGHGVGVEIHEWPRFATGSKELTRPGMVVFVEPGIYLEGKFGLRIEDLVVITEDGCEDITKSRKDLDYSVRSAVQYFFLEGFSKFCLKKSHGYYTL